MRFTPVTNARMARHMNFNVIYHINEMKEKTMIILTKQRHVIKTPYPFRNKTLKLRLEGNYLNIRKNCCAHIYIMFR